MEVLISMKLNQLMTKNLETCSVNSTLTDVAKIMSRLNVGAVPVMDGQKLAGIITDRDIVIRCVEKGDNPANATAGKYMSTKLVTATPDTDAHEAASLMAEKQIRRLPIVEGDRLVGIVALGDMATVNIHVDEAGQALSDISVPSRPGAH